MPILETEVTLICVDSIDAARAARVLNKCTTLIPFKHVKLIGSLPGLLDATMPLNAYSDFCIRHLHKYFETSHCLIVQHDGWIVNPAAWRDEWLAYDYIGCATTWSEPGDNGKGGCGGFSLRSKRLMELASRVAVKTHEEDVILSHAKPRGQREDFEAAGMMFAPNSVQKLWGFDVYPWRSEFGHHRASNFGPYSERCRQV